MANKETIEKVKSLLDGHCYGPLREAAEKWLDMLDEFSEKADSKAEDMAKKVCDFTEKYGAKADEVAAKIAESEAAAKIGAKYDEAAAKLAETELVAKLKEGIATVDEMIELFGSEEGRKKFGEEMAGRIKGHAEDLKTKGEKFCDCDACRKAREILKDLGEKLDDK